MRRVVLISGRLYTGKSGLARLLTEDLAYHPFKTSEWLAKRAQEMGRPIDRLSLQALGDEMDDKSEGRWIHDEVLKEASALSEEALILVDNIRSAAQLDAFRGDHDLDIVHVHLYANNEELEARFKKNNKSSCADQPAEYEILDHIKKIEDVESLKLDADVRINTARTDNRDTFVRVAARLGHYSAPDIRCVDVIVGGQYGSEGKGHIAAYLAKDYDVLMRVGGPNAGHTVSGRSGIYVYHQLPSGAKETTARLLLGPGMTIHVQSLLKEIADCEVTEDRLFIDPQAMIIEDNDRTNEVDVVAKIASTGTGSGRAASRRIRDRGKPETRLARDIPELQIYVGQGPNYRGATTRLLEDAYRNGSSILLEGTQGSGLSIFHGPYPYVTSRDTNVAGCLAEAGISPSRVRKILMVIRVTPIRVANPDGDSGETSGPLKHEINFEMVARSSGINVDELITNEKTSTTKRPRRVGWFEWEQFRNACALNAPTDVVLTFADYMTVENRGARRFEQLSQNTIKFVEELERVAQAPVSLINTRFPREDDRLDLRTVIDRRNWTTSKKRI